MASWATPSMAPGMKSPAGSLPREIADSVVFLASSRASYVTGAVLAMDGALTPIVA